MIPYASPHTILPALAARIGPPIRRPVSESARRVVKVRRGSGTVDSWSAETTPYMVEPMDQLESRRRRAVVFIGPAQSGKTQALIDCWIGHVATCSPSDMMVLQATQNVARDFERTRVRRLMRDSAEIAAAFSPRRSDDNTYDKTFATGDTLFLGWPSENTLQGKPLRRIALTDYDRMPLNVGGQGAPYDLAYVRGRSYRSLATILVESSPGHEASDPQWSPTTPHQAPPAPGIFSLFNLGDKRRLYWRCPECQEHFMAPPGPDAFIYEVDRDLLGAVIPDTVREVRAICTGCGAPLEERWKQGMLAAARWVPEGCRIEGGELAGDIPDNEIASYWLHGIHAVYQPWRDLIRAYLQARHIFETTGSEESLRARIMQDFAAPYVSQARQSQRSAAEIERRAENLPARTVPPEVRYLVAQVDVQAHAFVVQVVGHGPQRERWIVDWYQITNSRRRDHLDEPVPVDPAAYQEDWGLITERVVCARYPLAANPERHMAVRLTVCDSGGRAGVTTRAYQYYRSLRKQRLAHRFALLKGNYARPDSRAKLLDETYPDNTHRSDRHAGARGDVPVYLVNVNELKDGLDADLKRETPGPGYIHCPRWLERAWFDGLVAEVRTGRGWEKASGGATQRNEPWDLLVYDAASELIPQTTAGIVTTKGRAGIFMGTSASRIDWERPPPWALAQPENSEVGNEIVAAPIPSRPAAEWKRYEIL